MTRRPRWLPLLVAALATAGFAGLGLWQLERARAKGELLAALDRAESGPTVTLPADPGRFEALAYQRVRLTGRLRGDRQFLLDNRIHQGRPGFDVLVPLVRGNGDTVLVDRGWVPATATREPAQPVALKRQGEVEARGLLWLPEPALALGPALAPTGGGWPRLVTRVDYDALGQALGTPLLPAVVRLDPSIPWALTPRPLRPQFGPMRHIGYAVQWFALALTVLIVTGLLLHRARRGRRRGR